MTLRPLTLRTVSRVLACPCRLPSVFRLPRGVTRWKAHFRLTNRPWIVGVRLSASSTAASDLLVSSRASNGEAGVECAV